MTNQPKQLVAIGDSGVYGWGDKDEGGWCERLRRNWMNLPQAPIVYQLGIRGDGLEKVAQRWKTEWKHRGELRRKLPDGVLISVGINDTARIGRPDGRPQLSSEAFRFGYYQLLKDIKNHTNVLVMGLTPVDETVMPFAECLWYTNKAISVYESQIEETCLDLNIPFLPLYRSMIDEPNWINWLEPDGIHMNTDGHYWVYKKLISWNSLLMWGELNQSTSVTPSLI